jgi:hypothetical protein
MRISNTTQSTTTKISSEWGRFERGREESKPTESRRERAISPARRG